MQTPPRLKMPQWASLAAICSTFGPASLLYFLKMMSYLLMQVSCLLAVLYANMWLSSCAPCMFRQPDICTLSF
jgi:hypothetical protein